MNDLRPDIDAPVAIIGAGPAGLMAAEVLATAGHAVHLFDAMPSVGRKFLLAGRGGLNLTHSEPMPYFVQRFGARRELVQAWLAQLSPQELREWAQSLGVQTFVGSSGRVFPQEMKAAPLLRAWLHRLRDAGVHFHMRHRWRGDVQTQNPLQLCFDTPLGLQNFDAAAVVLALGGGSWPRLGSDGRWWPWLQARGIDLAPLQPANCGFERSWSEFFRQRFAGQPFKLVALRFVDAQGRLFERKGEFVATEHGVEGSLIYAASAMLRDEIAARGEATPQLDLLPDRSPAQVLQALQHPRGSRSLGSHLQSRLNLTGIKSAVLREVLTPAQMQDAQLLARAIKALPLRLSAPRPLDEAISSAGGVRFEALDEQQMLRQWPGVFVAGEMLDWEAPTGGYLLTASLASGRAAAQGLLRWRSTPSADTVPTAGT